MGLLDSMMPPQQPQGGLLGGMPAQQAPAGGAPQMPPEMMQVVQQLKQVDPATQQQMLKQIIEKIQASGKPPGQIQQAIQQLIGAVSG